MKSILEELNQPTNFGALIEEYAKRSTEIVEWEKELEAEYSATGAFEEFVAEYAATQAGSFIAKNADKPLRELPDVGKILGSVARLGDRWQLDNDRLDKLLMLEGRYRDRARNLSADQRKVEYNKLLKFAFGLFERATFAPHKRLDWAFYSAYSTGVYDVTTSNNPDGITFQLDLGIPTTKLRATDTVLTDLENSNPVVALQYQVNKMRAKGKVVTRMDMNFNTAALIMGSKAIRTAFSVDIPKGKVSPTGIVSEGMINEYFKAIGLPPIKVVDVFVTLPGKSGTTVNAFQDNRIVLRTNASVGKLVVKDALESKDPHPNKAYTSFKDNLISSYRTEQGRFVEYEMNALPVFTGKNDMLIIKVDEKDAA